MNADAPEPAPPTGADGPRPVGRRAHHGPMRVAAH